jgi:hypothetical protein
VRRPEPFRTLLLTTALLLAACGEKKQEQAEQAPPPPPAPVETVKAETVVEVAARLGVDKRIRMEESERPSGGDPAADQKRLEAILVFFDAMLNAKEDKLKPFLPARELATLDAMIRDGQWKSLGENVDRVNVGCSGPDVLAVFMVGDGFQGQLWAVGAPQDNPDEIKFSAEPTLPDMMDKLSGTTAEPRIKQWSALTRAWFERAKEPDVKVESAQEDRSVKGEDPSGGQTPGGTPGKTK